jgi:excinuclease UvrABC nuclease subunit
VFECNDISHISGNHTVASRAVIENGKLNKNKYRKLRIKTLENQKIDDFDSMREVMERRALELINLENYPDLLIID